MVYSESAKMIGAEELKEIIDEEYTNPTVERLMFLETKANGEMPGKIFPCYMEAWAKDEGKSSVEADKLMFQCCIVQCTEGQFSMLRVVLHEDELGIRKRIWDKPPTKGLREDHPWLDTEVTQ